MLTDAKGGRRYLRTIKRDTGDNTRMLENILGYNEEKITELVIAEVLE